jgi:hypothetical protein
MEQSGDAEMVADNPGGQEMGGTRLGFDGLMGQDAAI